jgi:hypothetical protein
MLTLIPKLVADKEGTGTADQKGKKDKTNMKGKTAKKGEMEGLVTIEDVRREVESMLREPTTKNQLNNYRAQVAVLKHMNAFMILVCVTLLLVLCLRSAAA